MIDTHPVTIITQNSKMRETLRIADQVASSNSSVLLLGETGVGKEIFADYIHAISTRHKNTIIKIGLSAMPTDLMASELFGHVRGSFTGASEDKQGLFVVANNGTVFLDDIDDVPLEIQTKLLRVLESRELTPIGGKEVIPVNIRLITASKVDLKELVKRQMFRSDLLYRLNVVTIKIPPLRERMDDIPLLTNHFMRKYAPDRQLGISEHALSYLMDYHWPGNIRELRNVIQRASLFASDVIQVEDFPEFIRTNRPFEQAVISCTSCFTDKGLNFKQTVSCLEQKLITEALTHSNGNQSYAAKLLNLSLSTFRDKMKKYADTSYCERSEDLRNSASTS
ncbi:sigma-54 interaction domain-containing protein [Bacteroidota bacterium]